MKKNVIISEPTIGMGATINHWTDRSPATVIQITNNRKRIVLQEDKAIRIDSNGMSEYQEYSYEPDSEGIIYIATLRKDGQYKLSKSTQTISLGIRRKYHDYSF